MEENGLYMFLKIPARDGGWVRAEKAMGEALSAVNKTTRDDRGLWGKFARQRRETMEGGSSMDYRCRYETFTG